MNELPLALSVGCPSGIGPEIAVEACARWPHAVLLVGDRQQLVELASQRGVELTRHTIVQPGDALALADRSPGHPTPRGGAAQLAWIDTALGLVRSGRACALVTGPVSKAAIATSGIAGSEAFRGHTEYLQEHLEAREVVMAFWSSRLITSLVTTHVPLGSVSSLISPARVASSGFWLAWLLCRLSPQGEVRVAVAGLNPHAGEKGLLGDEETKSIGPGIRQAEKRAWAAGLRVTFEGPLGAETAFRLCHNGHYQGVVAMYHDQATIAMKLIGFGDAVNLSLGLPIVRTSVDHGTAYDIAGQGVADPSAMLHALTLAYQLSYAVVSER